MLSISTMLKEDHFNQDHFKDDEEFVYADRALDVM